MPTKYPRRVYAKHGSLWFVDRANKWHKLCRAAAGEAAMHKRLAELLDAPADTSMPAAIACFAKHALKGLAVSTQKEHARLLDVAAAEFADFTVDQVRAGDIARSAQNLYPDKPTAARAYKARLSTFFRWAVIQDLRTDNPCREVWLAAPPKRDRYITDDEFARIRAALLIGADGKPTPAGEMARAFAELCYLTAQRPTEIRRLTWSQVREREIAFKPSKTAGSSGAKVLIPRTPTIDAVLERARTFGAVRSIFVMHAIKGSPYTMSGIRSAWQRACKRCGITDATLKDLRPKALTDARRAGYSKEQLQVAAAHASVTTTEGYIRTFEEQRSVVVLTLADLGKLDNPGHS